MSDHEIILFSSLRTNQWQRSFRLAVTPQKSETLNESINQDHTTTILATASGSGSHKNGMLFNEIHVLNAYVYMCEDN